MSDRYFLQTMMGSKTPPPRSMSGQYTVAHALPEGVDLSEGGWATDFAASLVGLLYLFSAVEFYQDENDHWAWMFGGTLVAHFFGGLAHRYFPNRALEGVGNYGFYVCMMLGYGGNCLRYGFGWDLGDVWQLTAVANIAFLILSGILVMCTMKPTTLIVDNTPQGNQIFWADRVFGLSEAVCSVMEVLAGIYYGYTHYDDEDFNGYIVAAIALNIVGWFVVYFFALLYVTTRFDYNPSLMQQIFHYCMIAMLWAIDANVQRVQQG